MSIQYISNIQICIKKCDAIWENPLHGEKFNILKF